MANGVFVCVLSADARKRSEIIEIQVIHRRRRITAKRRIRINSAFFSTAFFLPRSLYVSLTFYSISSSNQLKKKSEIEMHTKRISINSFWFSNQWSRFAARFCMSISKTKAKPEVHYLDRFCWTKSSEKWKQAWTAERIYGEKEVRGKKHTHIYTRAWDSHILKLQHLNAFGIEIDIKIDKRATRTQCQNKSNKSHVRSVEYEFELRWPRPKSVLNSHQNQSF